jgi:hypothetical protein
MLGQEMQTMENQLPKEVDPMSDVPATQEPTPKQSMPQQPTGY